MAFENATKDEERPTIPPDVVKWCPFCGGSPKFKRLGGINSKHFTVACSKCKCDLSYYATLDLAISAWNSRIDDANPPLLEIRMNKLIATLEHCGGYLMTALPINQPEWLAGIPEIIAEAEAAILEAKTNG